MGRPKKEKTPLPEQSPSNPNQVQGLLSKAKETLALAKQKRKCEGEEGIESVPTPCKAKTAPPCPKVPQQRLRSKSPANMTAAPKQAPPKPAPAPKPAASAPSSSAWDRVQAVLVRAKAMKMDVDQKSKAAPAPPPKQAAPAPPAKQAATVVKAAPLVIKAVSSPPPKAVAKATSAENLSPGSVAKSPDGETLEKAPALPPADPVTPPPKASLTSPQGSVETLTSTADTMPDMSEESGKDDGWGENWKGHWESNQAYYGWNYGWHGSYGYHPHYWDSPGYDSQWRYDPSPHSSWREHCPPTPGSVTGSDAQSQVRECLANRMPSFADKLSKAGEVDENEDMETRPVPNDEVSKELPGELGEEQVGDDDNDDEEGGEERWMRDKRGNIISPKALYMRFYRKLRSTLEMHFKKTILWEMGAQGGW